mgnify:CR=1 FL=1
MHIKRNIIFAPESRKKDGIPVTKNVPIRMRVIFASQRIEFTTGYRIDVEKWDTDKQRVRNGCTNKLKQSASEINAELLRQYTEIQNVFKEFEVQDVTPTPAQIKEAFNLKTKGEKKESHEEKQKVELDFMKVFNEFVAECSKQNDWSSSTLKKFATVKKHIYTFDPNTTFDSWTEKHFNDYIEFLRAEKNMRNTSIAKQIKFVKWFLRWSNRKGYHQNMAYDKFTPKMKSAPKKVIFLTQNEINKLRTCPHPQSGMILAKEFMPLFIKNGIFNKDNREGLPIRKVLRDLDTENSLDKIPYVHTERKPKTINWYFRPLLLSLVIFMGMLSSCSFKSNTDFPEVTHVAFQKEKHGKWGMVGVNGNILFENKFDKRPSYAVNGVFRIQDYDTNQYLYYSATPTPKLIGTPKGYKQGGICSEGIIPVVSADERIHYLTETGETAFYLLPYQGKEFLCVSPFFTEQRAWFRLENRKCGYIDPQGNVVIEPIYDNAFPFHEGKAIVYNKEADKWLVIDPNGKELFEASSNGYQQYSYTFFENGYCLIENFLLNEKGEKAQRFPSNIYSISPFIDNVALFQDSKTGLWGQLNIEGESIGEPKYSRALGIIDDWIYVADTIANLRDEWDNQYMNVYAINSKGEIKNKIENVSCFYPLSQYAIMAENKKYYFADKKGNPIDNNSYYKISVPPFTDAPSYSPFWSSLIAPHSMSDYDAWGVVTNYIDEKKTLASIFDKLTSDGIDSLKMGQTISRIMDLYNIKQMPANGMVDLHNRDWGINQVFATYSVGILYKCKCAIVIKVEINASASPIGDNPQRLFDAIPQYLTETLGLKREDENLYRSEDACYDIVYYEGENSFFLMSKAITEK